MKKANKLALIFFVLLVPKVFAQEKGKEIIKLHYYNSNNSVQYLIVESLLKKSGVVSPQANKNYDLYLDGTNLVAKLKTDETGKAKAFVPISLKSVWDAAPQHTFSLKVGDDEVVSDYVINKAKITLDTLNNDGVRSIVAGVSKFENGKWIPAKDVEMKVGIQRLGAILSAGDDPTYTTDSSGTVTVELKKTKIPGDEKGNVMLAAKVEDNESFGNLIIEKQAKWGIPTQIDHNFFHQRTLWSTRFHTPYWLLFMAYSIILGVWGTLFYLIRQVIKIKKLGQS